MSAYKLRCFGNPEVLRKVSFENLMRLLKKFKDYFVRVNFLIPDYATEDTFDYKSLISRLLNPMFDITTDLFDALVLIDAMSREEFFDILLEHIVNKSYAQPLTEKTSAADLAVQIYLNEPELLKRINDRVNMKDPRSFLTFIGIRKTPDWHLPTEKLDELQRLLNQISRSHGRGETVRISKFQRDNEFCFLIRKGEPFSRHGAIFPGHDETKNIICQFESFDVVVFNPENGRLRMTIGGVKNTWMSREYPRMFGYAFFRDYEFFINKSIYDFDVIRNYGKSIMSWKNIPGISEIKFIECMIARSGAGRSKRTYKSNDVFLEWETEGIVLKKSDNFLRMKFQVLFKDCKRKIFTLYSDNRSGYKYDNYAMLFEEWLLKNKILTLGFEEGHYEKPEHSMA